MHGHLNTFFTDKTMKDFAGVFMLAPDYFFSRRLYNLKTISGAYSAVTGNSKNTRALAGFLTGSAIAYALARALNYAFDDDDDPFKVRDLKHAFAVVAGNRSYDVRIETQDLLSAYEDPRAFVSGRISPLSRFGLEYLSKRNYRGEEVSVGETVKNIFQGAVPMPIQGFVRISDTAKNDTKTPLERLWGAQGLQIKRVDPEHDMYRLARDWQAKHGKEFGLPETRAAFPTSPYTPMRYALADDDAKRAKAELEKLLASGKTRKQIREGFEHSLDAKTPLYIKQTAANKAFLQSLTDSERKIYEKDKAQRKEVWRRFTALLRE